MGGLLFSFALPSPLAMRMITSFVALTGAHRDLEPGVPVTADTKASLRCNKK
jgi:hypothetical protein